MRSVSISHHTYNVSLHYLVKHIIKNITYLTQYHNFALLLTKINQINLILCVLLRRSKC